MQHFLNSSFTIPAERNEQLESLLKIHCHVFPYPAKTKFLEYGDAMDGVYYVFQGRTKHYILAEDGAEKILYCLSSGWFFGETPLTLHEPTGLISETMEPSILWKIPYSVYDKLLDVNKLFRTAIMNCMSRKMLIMRHEIENQVFNPCKQRILQLLCSTVDNASLVEGKWYNLSSHYTQYEISTIIGSARVTTSKLINELCNEGFIRILNRKLQVSKIIYEEITDQMDLL
ncbi:cAMP-binding protein [Sphaerochaeta pleomorpha str. Grapes]|uniref:cAMP-binding protein n=1 Tax=Sphaerochaeta pleomorpha (strain ATCC BAA-1885 / DSM 22778 / Grapes) TaxID=158190 RepID=G8QX02_SPHPG|nr:Crp/Fnr family transcriptional regulator [Sphaerochaeta pleomorpha]AEV29506.1 cAMP-binding protein [Sphaerochaeta pleomorpha str. Grapes]